MRLSDSTLWEKKKKPQKAIPFHFALEARPRLKWERGVWRFIWVALTIAVKVHPLSWGTLGENSEARVWDGARARSACFGLGAPGLGPCDLDK